MPLFRPFVTGSDESEWGLGLAIRILHFCFSAQIYCQQSQTVSFIKGGWLLSCLCTRLSFALVMCFRHPSNSFCVLLKISLRDFFGVWGFLFLLLVFQLFLGPNIRFVIKTYSDSDFRDVSVRIKYEHWDFAECTFLAVLTVSILHTLQVMAK